MTFTVIDKKTGKYPDTRKIALREKWAHGLVYCDIEGFALQEDGTLILLDECGNVAYCPPDRFEVRFDNENPWHTGTPTEEGWYVCQTKGRKGSYLPSVLRWNGEIWTSKSKRPLVLMDVVKWQKIEEKDK